MTQKLTICQCTGECLQLLLTARSSKLLFAHTSQLLHQCSVALTSGLLSGLTCVIATATLHVSLSMSSQGQDHNNSSTKSTSAGTRKPHY